MRFRRLPILLAFAAILVMTGVRSEAQDLKYWVFLAESGDVSDRPVGDHVTRRALERRAARGTVVPGTFDHNVNADYVGQIEAAGADVRVRSRWLNAVSAVMADDVRDRVSRLPFVSSVRPVGVRLPMSDDLDNPRLMASWPLASAVPSQPPGLRFDYGSSFRQLEISGMVGPIEEGLDGSGVRLGVIDTGTGDLMHTATAHLVENGQIIAQEDFSGQPPDPSTHARMVLAVAAGFDEGRLVGPARGAEILLARSEYTPTETNQEEDAFVAAIEWMEAQGADVVNISLGYTQFDAGQHSYTYSDMDGDTAITTIAADLAVRHGVVVVNSAGNSACLAGPTACWYYIGSPGDADSVITAGGVQPSGLRYSSSSWGPTADGRTKPDVSAQATGVTIPFGSGYSTNGAGTSFASPMVAAAAVLLLQEKPDLTPIEIRDLLRATASQAQAPDYSLGWGIIDLGAALDRLRAAERFELLRGDAIAVYPNPFSGSATVLVEAGDEALPIVLDLYDALGRLLWTDTQDGRPGSVAAFRLAGRDLPAGVLVYRIRRGTLEETGTLVHLR